MSKSDCNSSDSKENDKELWIFGYGSLIWKQNFPFTKEIQGEFWCRRQESEENLAHNRSLHLPASL
jgi:hypothetical protein